MTSMCLHAQEGRLIVADTLSVVDIGHRQINIVFATNSRSVRQENLPFNVLRARERVQY